RASSAIDAEQLELLEHHRTVGVSADGLVVPPAHQGYRRSAIRIEQADPDGIERHDPAQLIHHSLSRCSILLGFAAIPANSTVTASPLADISAITRPS